MTELVAESVPPSPGLSAVPSALCPDEQLTALAGFGPVPLALVTVGEGSPDLGRRLQRAGIPVSKTLPWGSNETCRVLLDCRPAMLLLDCSVSAGAVADFVRAAALIAPVTVLRHERQPMLVNIQNRQALLRPSGQAMLAAFRAGALDFLDPKAPVAELAARIRADLRSCAPWAEHTTPLWNGGSSPSQRLLFDLIARTPSPICCHSLTQLLGTAKQPLTVRALRARVHRLLPVFESLDLRLVVDQWRGVATYRVDRRPHVQQLAG
jgi:hypothetical protein